MMAKKTNFNYDSIVEDFYLYLAFQNWLANFVFNALLLVKGAAEGGKWIIVIFTPS